MGEIGKEQPSPTIQAIPKQIERCYLHQIGRMSLPSDGTFLGVQQREGANKGK